jgi:hypothetical protein
MRAHSLADAADDMQRKRLRFVCASGAFALDDAVFAPMNSRQASEYIDWRRAYNNGAQNTPTIVRFSQICHHFHQNCQSARHYFAQI